jgi:Transcription factor TFIIB repeat.
MPYLHEEEITDCIDEFCERFDHPETGELKQKADKVCQLTEQELSESGCSPREWAAGAVYAASCAVESDRIPQRRFREEFEITEYTIRKTNSLQVD